MVKSSESKVSSSSSTLIKFEIDRFRAHGLLTVGVDEAGRGPLAGPVVAAAACFLGDPKVSMDDPSIRDSKMITSEEERERIFERLLKHPQFVWGVSVQSNDVIDEINILQATMKGMKEATKDLLQKGADRGIQASKVMALIDGNRVPEGMPCEAQSVISGDSLAYSISAASVIAKVTRDRLMHQLHEKYPIYGFDQHKGYPSPSHRATLWQVGPCPEHRVSYRPVREAAEKHNYTELLSRVKVKETMSPGKSSPKKARKATTPKKTVRASPKEALRSPLRAKRLDADLASDDARISPPSRRTRCAIL